MSDPDRRLKGALLRMRAHAPFFGVLALFAELRVVPGLGTACTDGVRLSFDPDFVRGLNSRQLDGVLLHELLHAALLHPSRRQTREPARWNVAADIVVNGIVAAEKWADLPAGALRLPNWEKLSAEEIYELLDDAHPAVRAARAAREAGGGQLDADLVESGMEGGQSNRGPAEMAAHWRMAHAQARAMVPDWRQRTQGDGSLGLEREVRVVEEPSVDWRVLLWQHVVRTPSDFGGFDRRFVHRGLYFEELAIETVRLFVAVDTSGSISDRQLGRFLGELRAICRAYPNIECELYYADTELFGPFPLDAEHEARGHGGTRFEPFFERLEALEIGWDSVALYLTDGFGTFPRKKPSCATYWLVTPGGADERSFPFGQVLRMTTLEEYAL